MDIAALSIILSQNKVKGQVGMSVMKMAMDVATNHSDLLISQSEMTTKALESSVRPFLGENLDLRA